MLTVNHLLVPEDVRSDERIKLELALSCRTGTLLAASSSSIASLTQELECSKSKAVNLT